MFHHLRQKDTVEYNWDTKAGEEKITIAGDMWAKVNKLAQANVAGALVSCTPYDSKRCRTVSNG